MVQSIIVQWEQNKDKLREYFKNTKQAEYSDYTSIVKAIFKLVVLEADECNSFDVDKMTVINDGDYQGTQIFLIPKETYQPNACDYIVTNTYYGSCSGCDTLQGISEYDPELPNENQVDEYMALSLHLVQKMKWLYTNED